MPELDLKPTAEMAANAARGLELREKHGKGGTAVGVARARDIKNRANLSPSTVRRMHSFFSRHEGNQAGGEDDAGYIAWLLWGGDAGKAWAARKSEQLDKSESARFSHDIRLPKGKRRLNIDEAHAALAQMGYKLGTVRYDSAAGGSVYKVTQPNGSVIDMPAAKLTDLIYKKAKHMKSGTKAAMSHIVGITGNPYEPNAVGTHRFKVGDKVKTDSVVPMYGKIVRLVRNNYGYPAYVVDVLGREPTDTEPRNRNQWDEGHIVRASRAGAKSTHAADEIGASYLRDIAQLKKYIEEAYNKGRGSHALQLEAQLADMERALAEYKARKPARASRAGAKAAFADAKSFRDLVAYARFKFNVNAYQAQDIAGRAGIYMQMNPKVPIEKAMDEAYRRSNAVLSAEQKAPNYTVGGGIGRRDPSLINSRAGAKAAFAATVAGAAAYTKNLVKSLGFYPDAVRFDTARDLLVLEFTSAPIIAVNCASKLSHALSTRGLGAQRVSINQSMEQRGGEDVGVVEINLDDVASRGLNSRAGAKAAFSESAAWIAKYLPALNQWWRDRTDHPTDLDASSDRWEIEGVLDDVAEHCREAVPREAKPSWYAAALRDVKKIPHARKASMKSHFAVKKSVSGTFVTLVPKAKGSGWKSYYAEWPSAKDARVTHHGVLVERDDGRVTLTHTSGQVVSEGNAGFGSMSAIRMSRAGAKAAFADDKALASFLKKWKRNEADNAHTENVVMLAQFVGSSDEIAEARDIQRQHDAIGHLPSALNTQRYALYKNLKSKLLARYPNAAFSRAGAKAAFAHPSWSAGLLGKETAPQLAAYSWIDAHLGINGHRTQMLLADIAAEVHARNPALSIQQAIMKAAQEMVQKGVATYDIRALVEDKGWMSRAGAKAKFSVLHLKNLIEPLRRADAAKNTREMGILLRRAIAICKAGEIEFPRSAHEYENARAWLEESLDLLQSDGAASLGRGSAARNLDNALGRIMSVGKRFQEYSRAGAKAAFGLERSINIMLSDARIPDSAFDWVNGVLVVDPSHYDRIVEVLNGYIPWELNRLPRIQKQKMSRAGAKATHATDNMYYTVAAHIGDQPAGERTTKSLDEAKAYAKAMLAALKPNAKGKPLVVDVYPVVNYSPQASVLSLKASRTSADSNRLTLAQRIAVEHDAKRMANR